ncbi:acetate--CoA ligase family protein [Thermodesulfobacteriota bacterium]
MPEAMRDLTPLFHPRSVAFVGASNKPGKWGFIILANLVNGGYEGPIYPVNPRDNEVQGLKAYPSVAALPETPDMAVIVVPPPNVPKVVQDCVDRGIRAGVVITAGFAEVGDQGEKLQHEMVEVARSGGMVLVGPNCNGINRPSLKLYCQMPPVFPQPGSMAIVAQSGNVATSVCKRGMKNGFGWSSVVSSGNEADLHSEDYYGYFAEDPQTEVILGYIEGFRDGRRFLEMARKVSARKPIVVIKGGYTQAGASAVMSHTASLAGLEATFEGACRQAGIIRAKTVNDLFYIGAGFLKQPIPKGRRVAILTGGGGWGVLAADACGEAGLEVFSLPFETLDELDSFLPPWWSRSNPIDLVAGLQEGALHRSLDCLLRCPGCDGVILLGIVPALPMVPLSPSAGHEAVRAHMDSMLGMAENVIEEFMDMARAYQKPVVIASEFPAAVGDFEAQLALVLGEKGHVCYPAPQDAVTVMDALATYGERRRSAV